MIIPILPLLNVEQCVLICSNNVIHITFAAWKVIFASSFIPSEFKPLFHCIPVLQIVTERGRVFIMLLYMELKVGILVSPCPSLRPSPHYSPCYSPHYGLDAENWECGNILRVISALWLKCGDFSVFLSEYSHPHFLRIFFHIRTRRFLRVPVRILPSAFSPHFLRIFSHIRMRRFLRVPVRILSSTFSPQGKCGDLGYGCLSWVHINGLVHERRNSIANALDLRLACINPSIFWPQFYICLFSVECEYYVMVDYSIETLHSIYRSLGKLLMDLTYWGRDKMDAISQTTFLSAFSWMKTHECRLKFHWSLFIRVKLTISQHWFR